MTYPKVCLRRGEETGVRAGKPWIFENQLDWADDVCKDGGIVDVLDSRMRFAARGYFNSQSKITVRVLTRDESEVIDPRFLPPPHRAGVGVRRMLGFENSCRVVFGEVRRPARPDRRQIRRLPLVSDRLARHGAMEGRHRRHSGRTLPAPRHLRAGRRRRPRKRRPPQIKECVYGAFLMRSKSSEHDARMLVSIENGQKTGHFLDQQENRGRLGPYAKGRTVFGSLLLHRRLFIHAALYGAKSVRPSTSLPRRSRSSAATLL